MNSDQVNEAFIKEVQVSFVNMIESHFEKHGIFSMSKRIVNVIIGDNLFQLDDRDDISKACALSFFKLFESSDGDVNSGEEYSVVIKTLKRFSFPV